MLSQGFCRVLGDNILGVFLHSVLEYCVQRFGLTGLDPQVFQSKVVTEVPRAWVSYHWNGTHALECEGSGWQPGARLLGQPARPGQRCSALPAAADLPAPGCPEKWGWCSCGTPGKAETGRPEPPGGAAGPAGRCPHRPSRAAGPAPARGSREPVPAPLAHWGWTATALRLVERALAAESQCWKALLWHSFGLRWVGLT